MIIFFVVAGTWSNGGDHMTFLGSYGGGMPAGTEAPVPQPYGTDLSQATMFSAGAAGQSCNEFFIEDFGGWLCKGSIMIGLELLSIVLYTRPG